MLRSFQLGPPGGGAPTGGWSRQVAFTPDGRHLISGNPNGTVYVLRLKEWSPTMGAELDGKDGADNE